MAIWQNLNFDGSIFLSDEVMGLVCATIFLSDQVMGLMDYNKWPYGEMFILIWI